MFSQVLLSDENVPKWLKILNKPVSIINLLSGILAGKLVYVPPNGYIGDERNPSCIAGLAKRNSEVKAFDRSR